MPDVSANDVLDEGLSRLPAAGPPVPRGPSNHPPRAAAGRDALGKLNRVADWEVYLRAQLAEEPWRDILARWWPRLLPGVAAAATHGIIRASHAARSLASAGAAGDAE